MTKNIYRKKHITSLRTIRDRKRGRVDTATRPKINTVIDLYEDRKIVQHGTAEKLIKGVTATNDKNLKKGVKAFDKAIKIPRCGTNR